MGCDTIHQWESNSAAKYGGRSMRINGPGDGGWECNKNGNNHKDSHQCLAALRIIDPLFA